MNDLRNMSIRPSALRASLVGRDSGSRNQAATKLPKQSADDTHIGADGPRCVSTPPIAGPKIKPSPNAAPTIPMPRARFSAVVISAMYACAVGIFAPAIPPTIRAAKISAKRAGEGKREVRNARAEQPNQNDGAASDAVRPAPPDRREHELHQRVHRAEHAHRKRIRAVRLGIERQQRNDDAESEQIDEDGEKDDDERRHGF